MRNILLVIFIFPSSIISCNKIIFLLGFYLSIISCDGQKPKSEKCDADDAINIINNLLEVQRQSKYVDSISQNKKHLSFMIDSLEIDHKQYYEVKTGFNTEFHWETYTIFYVDKNNCNTIMVNEVISSEIISLEEWRELNKKTKNTKNMTNTVEFWNLFNEGTIIKFTSKDLDRPDSEIQEFKRKLELYEEQHPLIEDFDEENLKSLINNETFFDLQYYTDSSWLTYFIDKYKIDCTKLNQVMEDAIKNEDYNAVKILIEKGYIVSNIEKDIVEETYEKKKFLMEHNQKDGYISYLAENSKIDDISKIIKTKYLTNHIEDTDGYTNLRKEKNAQSEILQKIKTGERINVLGNTGDWWQVKTKEGKTGYVHKSRIKSGNNNYPISYIIYTHPDFHSSFSEKTVKNEIEIRYTTSTGWDFVSIDGTTVGYLPTEEALKEKEQQEKKKHSFLVEDEDDTKPEKKKGFWDNLLG
ncbi:MAG: SH3 domain-containing protein [Flavobacteriaceae bacterium]|jgi:SH3-like domain-containing protein|nr:SH3 domain-containing protein [Flavobacteriaceae bacterium]